MLPAIADGGAPAKTQLMGWSLHHFFVLSISFDALVGLGLGKKKQKQSQS